MFYLFFSPTHRLTWKCREKKKKKSEIQQHPGEVKQGQGLSSFSQWERKKKAEEKMCVQTLYGPAKAEKGGQVPQESRGPLEPYLKSPY